MSVTELASSRGYSANQGVPSAERTFIVRDVEDEAAIIALMGSELPAPDEIYPSSIPLPSDLFFYDYTITKHADSPRVWTVVARYKPQESGGTITVDLRPNEVGYRTVSGNLRVTFVDRWREERVGNLIDYPLDANVTANTDIGGYHIDLAGRPLSTQKFQQTLTIEITDGDIPDMEQVGLMIGTRNDSIFLGAAAGYVVFTGCTFTRVPDVHRFTISYEFVLDSEGHLIQYPALDSARNPNLDGDATADPVYFRQPFPLQKNFMLLSPYFAGL